MSALADLLRAVTPAPLRSAVRRFRLDRGFMQDRSRPAGIRAHTACELESLWPVIDAAHERWVRATGGLEVRGHPASFANLSPVSSKRLYALLRKLQPEVLGRNRGLQRRFLRGDPPRPACERPRAPLQRGSPGVRRRAEHRALGGQGRRVWFRRARIQDGSCRTSSVRRWDLRIGRSQDVLPPLLQELGQIDVLHARQRALIRVHAVRDEAWRRSTWRPGRRLWSTMPTGTAPLRISFARGVSVPGTSTAGPT